MARPGADRAQVAGRYGVSEESATPASLFGRSRFGDRHRQAPHGSQTKIVIPAAPGVAVEGPVDGTTRRTGSWCGFRRGQPPGARTVRQLRLTQRRAIHLHEVAFTNSPMLTRRPTTQGCTASTRSPRRTGNHRRSCTSRLQLTDSGIYVGQVQALSHRGAGQHPWNSTRSVTGTDTGGMYMTSSSSSTLPAAGQAHHASSDHQEATPAAGT